MKIFDKCFPCIKTYESGHVPSEVCDEHKVDQAINLFSRPQLSTSIDAYLRAHHSHRKIHAPFTAVADAIANFACAHGNIRMERLVDLHYHVQTCLATPLDEASPALEALHQLDRAIVNSAFSQTSSGRDLWERFEHFQNLEGVRAALMRNAVAPSATCSDRVGPFDINVFADKAISPGNFGAANSAIRAAVSKLALLPESKFVSRSLNFVVTDQPRKLKRLKTQAFASKEGCICLSTNFFAERNTRLPLHLEGGAESLVRGGIGTRGPRGIPDIIPDEQGITDEAAANTLRKELIVLHELAHLVHAGINPHGFRELKEGSTKLVELNPGAEEVSHYAAENSLEFTAEALMSRMLGGTLPLSAHNSLERMLRC